MKINSKPQFLVRSIKYYYLCAGIKVMRYHCLDKYTIFDIGSHVAKTGYHVCHVPQRLGIQGSP